MEKNMTALDLYGPAGMYRLKSRVFLRLAAAVLFSMIFAAIPAKIFAQQAVQTDIRKYDIAPGPLGPALEQFSRRCGINISYDEAMISNAGTKGLQGTFSVAKGLALLLEGTGIVALKHPAGWILKPKAGPVSSPRTPGTDNQPDLSQKHIELPGLVVSGTRDKEVISLEQAQRNLASDVSDLFDGTPSVVVGGGGRNAQRIYLRGIESTNLNMTIDGARQGRALFQHHGSVGGLDPSMLKQVEVQDHGKRGSGAPGHLGAASALKTLDAQDLLQPR